MARFVFDPARRSGEIVTLGPDEAAHLGRVLRLEAGDTIELLDGQDGRFSAVLQEVTKDQAVAMITHTLPSTEARTRVTLYQGLPKGDKMQSIVQKCVELGVHAIVPVALSRCVVKLTPGDGVKKIQKLKRIAQEAQKQAGRTREVEVHEPLHFAQAAGQMSAYDLVLVAWEEETQNGLQDVLSGCNANSIALWIGPEGGLTPEEVACIGGKPFSLGPRVLRTETAGMAALSMILFHMGDMGVRK